VIAEGAVMAAAGVSRARGFGFVPGALASSYFLDVRSGALRVCLCLVLCGRGYRVGLPAARAARVDVMQALRSE